MVTNIIKNKVFLTSLAGIIIISIGYSINSGSGNVIYKNPSQALEAVTLGELIEKDTDGDTIPDWEESLWGTDPSKKISNPDGTPDNIYIAKKRTSNENTLAIENNAQKTTLNDTDLLARQIFASVSSLKNDGKLTEENLESISKTLADGALMENTEIKYSIKDLKTVPLNRDTFLAYSSEITRLVTKYQNSKFGSELLIISQALNSDSSTGLDSLSNYITAYKNAATDLVSVPTPEDISDTYLSIINNYYNLALSLEKIKTVFKNPVVGFSGITEYSRETEKLIANTNILGTYFAKNAILFSKGN